MLRTKCLWAQQITTDAAIARLKLNVKATGANLVCIRTDCLQLDQLIKYFHERGVQVHAWRWPHARPNEAGPANDPAFAPNETRTVLELIDKDLDGYVFDIESDNNGQPSDWDHKGPANRAQIAADMVGAIAGAFRKRGTAYTLGLTSHQWGFSNYPEIPWRVFLAECNLLLPQTYWVRDDGRNGQKKCVPQANDYTTHKTIGTPEQALYNGFTDYANKKDKRNCTIPIVPIAGEIGCMRKGEITRFAELVEQRGLREAHFYVDEPGCDPDILSEIKAA